MSAWTVLAILMWMALGAAIALVCVVLRGRRLWKRGSTEGGEMFGAWLDRTCSVQLKGKWSDGWSVVAVSHKGAVAVRKDGAKRAKWIPKENVPERVRWTMGAKKANNGIEPGIRVKGVSGIPLTNDEWAQVAELEEKFDSTQGFLFREAMRAYLREKTWLRKGIR